jgi:hypothetical protein
MNNKGEIKMAKKKEKDMPMKPKDMPMKDKKKKK